MVGTLIPSIESTQLPCYGKLLVHQNNHAYIILRYLKYLSMDDFGTLEMSGFN